jgi:hypothetical protein
MIESITDETTVPIKYMLAPSEMTMATEDLEQQFNLILSLLPKFSHTLKWDVITAVGFIHGTVMAKLLVGEALEAYRVAQWAIDLLDGDPAEGTAAMGGSPRAMTLVWRGVAAISLGHSSWRDGVRTAIALERSV